MTFYDARKLRSRAILCLLLTLLLVTFAFTLPLAALTGDPAAVLVGAPLLAFLYVPITLVLASRARLQLAGCTYPQWEKRNHRMLVQSVEEISLAAGLLQPPRVLICHDVPGITAFVEGLTRRRATICVSRDAVNRLTREELQAVVAHEVAHILHGDLLLMTLATAGTESLRLWRRVLKYTAAVVLGAGILKALLGHGRGSKSRFGALGLVSLFLILAGLMLFAWLAHLCARLTYAKLRRLQEFAADNVAAFQLSRNPYALASALNKTLQQHPSHAEGDSWGICYEPPTARGRWLAEYPPTTERIGRILGRRVQRDAYGRIDGLPNFQARSAHPPPQRARHRRGSKRFHRDSRRYA